jgi:hypothetical protein
VLNSGYIQRVNGTCLLWLYTRGQWYLTPLVIYSTMDQLYLSTLVIYVQGVNCVSHLVIYKGSTVCLLWLYTRSQEYLSPLVIQGVNCVLWSYTKCQLYLSPLVIARVTCTCLIRFYPKGQLSDHIQRVNSASFHHIRNVC